MFTGNVLITGSSGRVGTILLSALGARAVPFDLPGGDVLDPGALMSALAGCSQVVHLAWNLSSENFDNGGRDPANLRMAEAVVDGALASGVSRVVLASSVHASDLGLEPGSRVDPYAEPRPQTPYGESKVTVERLGRAAAERGLDVVAIRFGGVRAQRDPTVRERGLWLRPDDCIGAVRCVLDAPLRPGRFAIFYAVSRGRWTAHSTVNEFEWRPRRRPFRR